MTHPKKKNGYRRISVDGKDFWWRLNTGVSSRVVVYADIQGRHPLIATLPAWRNLWLHIPNLCENEPGSVTPKFVSRAIQFGLANGWKPECIGMPFEMLYQNGSFSHHQAAHGDIQVLRYTLRQPFPMCVEFAVLPATFDIVLDALIAEYEAQIRQNRSYLSKNPHTEARRNAHLEMVDLMSWLQQQRDSHLSVIVWDTNRPDTIWCYAARLIYTGYFTAVSCPQCQASYMPSDCSIEEWVTGNDPLGMYGGQRLYCPNRHTIYGSADWNS